MLFQKISNNFALGSRKYSTLREKTMNRHKFCDTAFNFYVRMFVLISLGENSCVVLFAINTGTFKHNEINYFNQIVLTFYDTHARNALYK